MLQSGISTRVWSPVHAIILLFLGCIAGKSITDSITEGFLRPVLDNAFLFLVEFLALPCTIVVFYLLSVPCLTDSGISSSLSYSGWYWSAPEKQSGSEMGCRALQKTMDKLILLSSSSLMHACLGPVMNLLILVSTGSKGSLRQSRILLVNIMSQSMSATILALKAKRYLSYSFSVLYRLRKSEAHRPIRATNARKMKAHW